MVTIANNYLLSFNNNKKKSIGSFCECCVIKPSNINCMYKCFKVLFKKMFKNMRRNTSFLMEDIKKI